MSSALNALSGSLTGFAALSSAPPSSACGSVCLPVCLFVRLQSSRVSRRSESKWDSEEATSGAPYALRSKDDRKEQAAIRRSQLQQQEWEAEDHSDPEYLSSEGEEEQEEEEGEREQEGQSDLASSLRSGVQRLRSSAKAKAARLERAAELRAPKLPYKLTQGLDDAQEQMRVKKDQLMTQLEEDAASERDSSDSSGGLSSLLAAVADKGTSLLHTAADATNSLRKRIVNDAAPGLRHSIKAVREQIDAIDFRDDDEGEQQRRSADDDEEEEEEEPEGDFEEDDNDAGEEPGEEAEEGLQTRLRSRAAAASSAGKRAIERGRGLANDALHSDLGAQARQALGRAKSGASEAVQKARAGGERLAARARSTIAQFDLNDAQAQAEDVAETAKSRVSGGLRDVRNRVDDAIPGGLDEAESTVREGLSRAKSRVRDELDEAEEDLGMTDAAFNRTVARGLNKFDRVVEKDNNVKLPLAIIGSIFLLWLGAGLYEHFGTPIEPLPPTNMVDAARLAAHNLKISGLERLHDLEARTQELADRLAGRKRPLTWSEKMNSWASSARDSIFGARDNHFDMAHARDSIRNARDAVEERGYQLKHALNDDVAPRVRSAVDGAKQGLESARKFTNEKLIPGVRYGADRAQEVAAGAKENVQYHASHKDEYVQNAKDTLHRAENLVHKKAADLHLIPPQRNMAQRAWDWMTGTTHETYPQQAQRVAAELKERLSADIDKLEASLPHRHRTVGERIKAHLPGHHDTVTERVQAELQRMREELRDLQEKMTRTVPGVDVKGTAEEYLERARTAGYELRNGAYQLRDDVQHKAHDLTHRSLADRIKDGVKDLASHLPGGRRDTVEASLHRGVDDIKGAAHDLHERAHRNVPGIDVSGAVHEYANRARAAGYELRNGAYQLADRVRAGSGDAAEMVRDYAQQLEAQAQAPTHTTDAHYPTTHSHPVTPDHLASANEAVPLRTVLRDISDAQEQPDPLGRPVPRESLVDKVRHVVHDSVEAIKEHLHHNADALQPETEADLLPRAHTYQDLRVPSTQPLRDSIKERVQRAEDSVRTGIHRADESVRAGAQRVADSVLPSDTTLHHLRKEAEYVQRRTVHKGEELGHRVEEKYDQLGHRVEEKYDEVKDKVQYHLP